MEISLFKNRKALSPLKTISVYEFLEDIRNGKWQSKIVNLRQLDKASPSYKLIKFNLPAVTVSGTFEIRRAHKLLKHSGLICIDIDKKDNPLLNPDKVIDKECFAQFKSCSGEGIKIIYRCKKVKTASEHRRIFEAVIARLKNKGVQICVDPSVKSIANLQFVSFDPDIYINNSTHLILKPAPVPKRKPANEKAEDVKKHIELLEQYVELLGDKDVTKEYNNWISIIFGLSYSLGEAGREIMHKLCRNYPNYSKEECDEKFDACLEAVPDSPITIATVYKIIRDHLPKRKLRLIKDVSHVVNEAVDTTSDDSSELQGFVKYGLFLFKKIIDRKTREVAELIPAKINLNEFEALLHKLGFYRYNEGDIKFIQITDNIINKVDTADILRILTKHLEEQGDYRFFYAGKEFFFKSEELMHLWREVRANTQTWNQIAASLNHWVPDLLLDGAEVSYVPFKNTVVKVTKNDITLVPYSKIDKKIWKEQIIQRDFKLRKSKGMFEEFFINVTGRGDNFSKKAESKEFKRAMWYFGYILHRHKMKSVSRAWILYDINVGNSGRSGKTIIGEAVSKIRNTLHIDGKQFDTRNRFAFQAVTAWTDVVFIDDPHKGMSLNPLFNMITGNLYADKKNANPLIKPVKFMIASNWILELSDSSEIGRQFITQLDDFYIRLSVEKGTIKPLVDYHGKEFFTQWDEKDWSEFDNFAVKALHFHLSTEIPENTAVTDAKKLRFVQMYDEEMYLALCQAVKADIMERETDFILPTNSLSRVIRDYNENLTNTQIGRIAREFLKTLGINKITVTTITANNIVRFCYKMDKKELDFDKLK